MLLGAAEQSVAGAKFAAFISYAHTDHAAAQQLHRKLESYRVPRRLRGAGLGRSGGGIGKVFRDREDLPAAEDLTDSVKQALADADALVVVCTPHAKASHWVAREIELFRAMHPERPVLAALFEGEPDEAFPDALHLGREPLAADFRKQGDGRKLAFLKVVAGLARVPLDELVQRDAQRRLHRVTAVTVIALGLTLAMTFMTYIAIQSRTEAERQRAEAEGLVEYMLTDLREELRGVGRLDVMGGVNERALTYYDGQGDLGDFPADSLERRSAILLAMGEDELNRVGADQNLAEDYFREAFRTTRETLARNPNNPDRIFAHGQSQFWLGYFAYNRKDWADSAKWWLAYAESSRKLRVREGASQRALREQAYGEGNLCSLAIQDEASLQRSAVSYCHAALRYMRAAFGASIATEKDAQDIVNRVNWYARALERSQGSDGITDNYREAEAIIDELLDRDPDNLDLRFTWLTIQVATAQAELKNGERAAALNRLRSAKQTGSTLLASDGENRSWKEQVDSIERLMGKGTDNE